MSRGRLAPSFVATTGGWIAQNGHDIGINDDMIRRVGAELDNGKAAVFLLARSATVDRVADRLKPYNPTIIQST